MSFLNRRAAVGAAALALALGACDAGDPVSPAGGPQGQTQPLLAGITNATRPTGTATVSLSKVDLDPTLPDALGRISSNPRGRHFSTSFQVWRWVDYWRTNSAAKRDTRLPRPNRTTTINPIVDLYGPELTGAAYWEWFFPGGGFTGLKPATQYSVAMVHYRLGVNGQVDHIRRILVNDGANPDTLKILSGTAQRAIGEWTAAAPAGCPAYPGVSANPLIFAEFISSATGTSPQFDQCISNANGLGNATNIPTSLVGRSDNTTYELPNYNYIVIYETLFGLDSTAARMQIAQDLRADGSPVPNAFPPFPSPATSTASVLPNAQGHALPDRAASFPLPISQQVAFPAAVSPPDSVRVVLRNVQRLEEGVYKAWYVNRTTKVAKAAPGRYVRRSITVNEADTSRRDTTVFEDIPNTSTFKGGPEEILFTTRPYAEIGNPDLSDTLNFLLISIEQNESASQPSSAQPFWVRVFKTANTSVGGTVSFGDFNFNQGDATPTLFTAQGTFSGGVIGDTIQQRNGEDVEMVFVGSTVRLNFTGLTRPPEGYEYRAYLCATTCNPLLPASSFLDLGRPVGPGNEDLSGADSPSYSSTNVVGSRINRAFLSYDFRTSGGSNTVCDFDRFRLALQPKGAVEVPTFWVIDAPLSTQITNAASCR